MQELGGKDVAPPSSQIYSGVDSLLFDDGWVLDGTSRAHKKVFDAITSFLILLPFITFAGANSHEPFGQNSHPKKKPLLQCTTWPFLGLKLTALTCGQSPFQCTFWATWPS
jgi:hypothetical protein